MRYHYFLLSLLTIMLLSSVTFVQAKEYKIGLKEGDEITAEVLTVRQDDLKTLWGSEDKWKEAIMTYSGVSEDIVCEKGSKMKLKINSVNEEDDGYNIKYEKWDWTTNDFEDSDEEIEASILKEPSGEWSSNVTFLLQDISNYLENYDLPDNYEQDKAQITLKLDTTKEGKVYITWTYNEKGVLSDLKLEYDDTLLYEWKVSESIPGYETLITITIAAISLLGFVFLIKKKLIFN